MTGRQSRDRCPVVPVVAEEPLISLWQLGFRPFYLLASLFAALSVPLWVAQYAGYLPGPYIKGSLWHGYEMLFGYTAAVITGFLFTAVRTWSGHPTPTRWSLAGFVVLWLAGRIMVFLPYPLMALVINTAFPLAVAVGIAVPLVRAASRRNYFVIVLLAFLGIASLLFQLASLNLIGWPTLPTLQVGLDLVLLLIVVIAGRVVPMFSNSAIPGLNATRSPLLERLALGSVAALIAADILQPPPTLVAVLTCFAALVHAARLIMWRPRKTLTVPLVWILHAAYGWVAGYLLLRSLAAFNLVPISLALHGLTIGVIGSITIGMMARTSLGHTGRPLTTGWRELPCFLLVQCAAVARVAGGLLFTDVSYYVASVIVAGACWSIAFILFTSGYVAIWVRPRIDGKPG